MRHFGIRAAILASGCAALLFETLWLRLSGLAFGNSVWSAALVLSSFMAGLAIGSFAASGQGLRRFRPLRVYSCLEFTIAISGCLLAYALPFLGEWLRPAFQLLWDHQTILSAARFAISLGILLIPTTAMGMSLPILLGDSLFRGQDFNRDIAVLYGLNTLGAVTGALLGELYLVPQFGLVGTAGIAAATSAAAGTTAWIVSLGAPHDRESRSRRVATAGFPLRDVRRLLACSVGAGAILVSLEVVWFRFLRLYVASSSTAFALMLAVVLAGIGVGALLASLFRQRNKARDLPIHAVAAGAGLMTLLTYVWFSVPESGSYIESWRHILSVSAGLMFPTACLSGALLPLITSAVQKRNADRANSTGLTMLCNTTGAAIGPLVTTFVLLPKFGYQWALLCCAAGYAVIALVLTSRQDWSVRDFRGVVTVALSAALVLTFALFPYNRDEAHFAHARKAYEADGSRLTTKVEGSADTLQVVRADLFGKPYYDRLVTNGFSMSSTHPKSQRYMRLFAYLPLALRPESEDVLLICYGVGITADAFLHHSGIKNMDVVDTSAEVLGLASSYASFRGRSPLGDPRVHAHVQDGRFFLQASSRKYDVISGEPPPLKVAGTVNLYTEEFFRLMQNRLKEGGVATFWLPIYQLRVEETKAILRAFHNAFPTAAVWAGSDQEWIMMGIAGTARKLGEQEFGTLWSTPATAADLRTIGVEEPRQLGALFLMDGSEIGRLTDGTDALTDRFPRRLTDAAPDAEATHKFAWQYVEAVAALNRFRSSTFVRQIWPEQMMRGVEPFFVVRSTRYMAEMTGSNWLAELDLYLRHSELATPVLDVLNSDPVRISNAQALATTAATPPDEVMADLIADRLARRDLAGAIHLLESRSAAGFKNGNDLFLLTYLYCATGNVAQAEALAAQHASFVPKDWFVEWLWGQLRRDYGFHPPA